MSKFTFIREESTYCINSKQTVEFSAVNLDDVLQEFETFLRGAGFVFAGNIIIHDENDIYEELEELEALRVASLSDKDYFSNLPQNNWPFAKIETPGVCPVCKISNEIMEHHKCYDAKCPKGNTDANQG